MPNLKQTKILIRGRDTDQRQIWAGFEYPIWELTQQQVSIDTSKAGQAGAYIVNALKAVVGSQVWESELRRLAIRAGHTEYSIKTALNELEKQGRVQRLPDKTKGGNRKIVQLIVTQP